MSDVPVQGRDVTHPKLLHLLQDPSRVAEIPVQEIPVIVGDLERLKALLFARLVAIPSNGDGQPGRPPEADRLLPPEEAAPLLGVTVKWLYRHAKRLPFTRRLSRKALRFSEAGLRRWQAGKKP